MEFDVFVETKNLHIELTEKVEAKNAQIESIKAHCDALTKENAQKNTIITEVTDSFFVFFSGFCVDSV